MEVNNMGSLETKKQIVAEMVEKFNGSKSVIVTDYRGLNVAEVTELRKQLREAGVDYRVVKNTLLKIAKEHKNLEIKGGILEGQLINMDGVKALADLPPREVLLAKVASCFQAPMAGLVNVLQGPIRKLGYALEEVRKLKEAEA
jgi:large subunit ribosomal protein L10